MVPSPGPSSVPTTAPSAKPTLSPTYLPLAPTPKPSPAPTPSPTSHAPTPTLAAAASQAPSPSPSILPPPAPASTISAFDALPTAGKVLFPMTVISVGLLMGYMAATYLLARKRGEAPQWQRHTAAAWACCVEASRRCTGRQPPSGEDDADAEGGGAGGEGQGRGQGEGGRSDAYLADEGASAKEE